LGLLGEVMFDKVHQQGHENGMSQIVGTVSIGQIRKD
jgi:hypothetical protein